MDSVLGMLIFSAGGLAGATFLLPARWVKGWSYETWWFVYSLVGLVVCTINKASTFSCLK